MASLSSRLYYGAKTAVRTVYGNSNGSEVKVSMHQGSALSPLLFVMSWKPYIENSVTLPWELVVIAESEDDLIKRLYE